MRASIPKGPVWLEEGGWTIGSAGGGQVRPLLCLEGRKAMCASQEGGPGPLGKGVGVEA